MALPRRPCAATKPKFHVAAAQALIADVPPLRNELELKRMAMARLGKQVVDLKGASLRFGDRVILDDVDWIIGRAIATALWAPTASARQRFCASSKGCSRSIPGA